ncbi:LIM/homeobox protein lim-6 [Sabethes cyaneus]|uniref:LIM/homeobox protein lim-6 n=1 Tax=Sabethes cyaneus TaxID=53552 RepID=UPI00237DCABB|nr:LIM/homeobox protein lim-6 [Sabethes cyaneus]
MLEFYHNLNLNTGIAQGQTVESNLRDNPIDGSERTDIVGTIKSEKTQEICEGCGQKIKDRYFMKIAPDQYWHEQCLLCCICHIQLNQSCFTKNTKVYCKDDYYRIYGLPPLQQQQHQTVSRDCYGCGERIAPNEMVMRAKNLVYHLNCFLCYTCNRPLQKGEPFSLRSGKLICQLDLEKDMYNNLHALHPHHNPYGEDDYLLEDGIRSRDGRRGPKRPRTILTSAQRRQFKASFDVSPKPCRKVREALAKDTGLSVRVVQVWFQNQRAKMKKISRKSKTGQSSNDGDKNHSDKDEKSVKLESPSSDHGHYLSVEGTYGSTSQPLNPNLPYSPDFPENSDGSMCSSDISLDESFDNLDEGTSDTMSLQNLDIHTNLNGSSNNSSNSAQNNTGTNLVNHNNNNINGLLSGNSITHIDKLYLMQNSYFNATAIEQ